MSCMLFESKGFSWLKKIIPSKIKSTEEYILLFSTSNCMVTVEITSKILKSPSVKKFCLKINPVGSCYCIVMTTNNCMRVLSSCGVKSWVSWSVPSENEQKNKLRGSWGESCIFSGSFFCLFCLLLGWGLLFSCI